MGGPETRTFICGVSSFNGVGSVFRVLFAGLSGEPCGQGSDGSGGEAALRFPEGGGVHGVSLGLFLGWEGIL